MVTLTALVNNYAAGRGISEADRLALLSELGKISSPNESSLKVLIPFILAYAKLDQITGLEADKVLEVVYVANTLKIVGNIPAVIVDMRAELVGYVDSTNFVSPPPPPPPPPILDQVLTVNGIAWRSVLEDGFYTVIRPSNVAGAAYSSGLISQIEAALFQKYAVHLIYDSYFVNDSSIFYYFNIP